MVEANPHARLEAFSDGVFAIALTLLIIDIKLPHPETIQSSNELWRALWALAPSVFAFILSFGVILITWFNHRGALRLVSRSSSSFIYANGFLLLTVVFVPFPTSLLGEFIGTDHAAPAVVLYDAVLAVQAVAWIFVTWSALNNQLPSGERAISMVREQRQHAYVAVALYSLLAILALWFPLAVAIVTTLTWIFWL